MSADIARARKALHVSREASAMLARIAEEISDEGVKHLVYDLVSDIGTRREALLMGIAARRSAERYPEPVSRGPFGMDEEPPRVVSMFPEGAR